MLKRWNANEVLFAEFDGFFPQDRHPEPVAQNLAEIEEFSKVSNSLNLLY